MTKGGARRIGFALLLAAGAAAAQSPPAGPDDPAARLLDEKARSSAALRDAEIAARLSAAAEKRLDAELSGLRADRVRITAALVEAVGRNRAAEERVGAIEDELARLTRREAEVGLSLGSRRAALAEVLAALQRMNRRDGPAILIRADDILSAIRASLLMGTVLPELRVEVEAASADLTELVRVRERARTERAALAAEREALAVETRRLAILSAYRREQLSAVETDLGTERDRAAALGRQADTLRDLVDRIAAEIDEIRRAADVARREAEAAMRQTRERFAAVTTREPVRLAPRTAFVSLRGTLTRPVAGPVQREFGAPDGQGGQSRGIVIANGPGALVAAPADGWIAYAGAFRSYGQLLIINAGGGYYLVLAGLGRVGVEVGQFVLAGEPLGFMGAASAASGDVEGRVTGLYVEFRKDGGPIDPSPWWAKSHGEKVRG